MRRPEEDEEEETHLLATDNWTNFRMVKVNTKKKTKKKTLALKERPQLARMHRRL